MLTVSSLGDWSLREPNWRLGLSRPSYPGFLAVRAAVGWKDYIFFVAVACFCFSDNRDGVQITLDKINLI